MSLKEQLILSYALIIVISFSLAFSQITAKSPHRSQVKKENLI